jgi:hypothetical protein
MHPGSLRRVYPHRYLCNVTVCHVYKRIYTNTTHPYMADQFQSYYRDVYHLNVLGTTNYVDDLADKIIH